MKLHEFYRTHKENTRKHGTRYGQQFMLDLNDNYYNNCLVRGLIAKDCDMFYATDSDPRWPTVHQHLIDHWNDSNG